MKKIKFGMNYNRGEIVLAAFPFTNLSKFKKRPVLIISNNIFNSYSNDIIVCGVTSNLFNFKHSVFISNKELISGHLPIESRIKVNKLFTIHKSLFEKKVAVVNKNILEKVNKQLIKLISS